MKNKGRLFKLITAAFPEFISVHDASDGYAVLGEFARFIRARHNEGYDIAKYLTFISDEYALSNEEERYMIDVFHFENLMINKEFIRLVKQHLHGEALESFNGMY